MARNDIITERTVYCGKCNDFHGNQCPNAHRVECHKCVKGLRREMQGRLTQPIIYVCPTCRGTGYATT